MPFPLITLSCVSVPSVLLVLQQCSTFHSYSSLTLHESNQALGRLLLLLEHMFQGHTEVISGVTGLDMNEWPCV